MHSVCGLVSQVALFPNCYTVFISFISFPLVYSVHLTVHCSNLLEVFEAVMRWVRMDPDVRMKDLPKLLATVRMPLLTPQYLTDRVSVEELIRTSHECR